MRSAEDWGKWVHKLASTEPAGRRYRAFHEKLERLAPNWREHMRSADFVSWGSMPHTLDGSCMFDRLFTLYDDPAFGCASFAALLKLHPLVGSGEDGQEHQSRVARVLKEARLQPGGGAERPLVPVLRDRYEVLKVLGRGGNGEVYLVWSRETTSVYALKLIRADLASDPTIRQMFRRECETWIRLGDHPNIAKAHFFDEMGSDLLVTMELVQSADDSGPSLADKLSAGRLNERINFGWFVNVCDGLAHAYAHGVSVHRDIKPGNILVDSDSTARVSDFGLAHSGFERLLDHETGAGTPHYMSPEQSSAQQCDQRSDIYSLGVTMYEACSGRLPFAPPTPRSADPLALDAYLAALREAHSSAPPPRLDTPLWPVIQRCMAKRAQDRYETVNELRHAIAEVSTRMGIRFPEPPMPSTDIWTYPEQGNSLMRLGKYDEAIAAFDRFLKTFSTDAQVLLNRACCLENLGRYDEAMGVYEPLARREDVAGLVNGSNCLRRLGRSQEALSYAQRAVEHFPNDADAWVALGGVQFGFKQWPDAVNSYSRAHQLQPNEPTPLYNIAVTATRIPDSALTNKAAIQFLKLAALDDDRRGSIERMLRTPG